MKHIKQGEYTFKLIGNRTIAFEKIKLIKLNRGWDLYQMYNFFGFDNIEYRHRRTFYSIRDFKNWICNKYSDCFIGWHISNLFEYKGIYLEICDLKGDIVYTDYKEPIRVYSELDPYGEENWDDF